MATAKGLKQILTKSPTDVVILSSLRTAVTRAVKGGFRDAYDHELLTHVLRATLAANPNLDPAKIDDVAVGVVLAELGGSKAARMAQLHAGFNERTGLHTVNRACSSGLQAVTNIGNAIAVGQIDVGVGAGMESMTKNYGSKAIPVNLWDELRNSPLDNARDCIMPMGLTSENVAKRYGVSREDQDAFAAESHRRASRAQKAGLFDSEIIPVKVKQTEPEHPDVAKEVVVDKDDGIRHEASVEKMAKLKPAFSQDGSSTAGNSSQISDGAAAALMMRRSTATELGLTKSIIGKWAGSQVAGCRPDEMGIGPAIAIPKLLGYTGLKTDDVNIWEINEAFASQALYCIRTLGLDVEKVNPRGGAIALGHPLGMTGTRQLATLMAQLQEGQVGVVSMCIGTGMGMAGLFVRE
ncbi:hypothetical protein PV04_05829 [Phialophora macrospora]|uniref:acetyl-CoA C-acyltransferase n=1 Tax=Phialophora macrospora TaxID=1851006 RepID=A0A0D2FEQ6_9EURO|nr:hypothetical protein PV04_05829 [Phialophora macrospora]